MAKQAKTQKKSVLDWLVPLICVLVVVGVLVGLLVTPISNAIDNNDARTTVLLEDKDGEVKMTRTVAQTITWMQLYQSFQESYSNYSIYKYYQSIFGTSLDLSSLISDSEVSWLEQNISYMKTNLGLTFYTQVDVSESTGITSADVQNSAAVFALYMASGINSNLGSYMTSTLDSLKHYVSIAGEAKAKGVTLDEEAQKNVEESIESFQKLPEAVSYKVSFKNFIKDFVGKAIREAYELMALASKYNTMVSNNNFEETTDAQRAAYVAENKETFYTAKYLEYTTENADLVEAFEKATSKDYFLTAVARDVLDKNYALTVAKYEQEKSLISQTDEYIEDIVSDALTGEGFGELVTYEKGVNDPEETIAGSIFTSEERSKTALYLVEGENAVYLVWFQSASEEKSEVRLKTFPYGGLESYADIEDFRASVYSDVINAVLTDETTYTHGESAQGGVAYMEIVDNALSAVKEKLPSEASASYKADAEEGSFEAWISTDGRKEGDVHTFETNKEGKDTQYRFVLTLTPMSLDETTTVNGGYLEYDSEDEAKAGKEKLSGKTGIELVSAMRGLSDYATVSSNLSEGDFDEDLSALKDWFFSSERKNGDVAILTVTKETEETDDDGEKKTETSYCLVCYRSTQKAWESTATTNYASEKTNDWVEAIEKDVKVNEKALEKLGVDLEEAEHDHSED